MEAVEVVEVELGEVLGRRGVHGRLGVFELGFVEGLGVFGLFLVGAGEEEFLVAVFAHDLDEVGEVLVAEEDFAFAVLDVVLQVESDGLGGAEVFHVLAYGFAQLFEHAEEMVYRVLAVEDDGGVFADVDACFSELGDGDAHHFEEFEKGDVNIVLVDEVSVRRFLQIDGCRLRNQDFFQFHALAFYCLNLLFYCSINHFMITKIGIISTVQR